MKTIVVSNRKGGTAKTTTAVNLAGELSKTASVLLIDLDTQGHASIGLGHHASEEGGAHKIFDGRTLSETFLPSVIDNLTLAPASAFFDVYDHKNISGILKQRYKEEELAEFFDYCIIDTPPTYDAILKNALEVSDCVIIPVIPHHLGFIGVEQVFRAIYHMSSQVNEKAPFVGILPVMYNHHIKEHKEIIEKIKRKFGKDKFFEPICVDIALTTQFEKKVPLVFEDTTRRGGKDYKTFVEDLKVRLNG